MTNNKNCRATAPVAVVPTSAGEAPALQQRAFFITGTDTGVGKTHLTTLLLSEFRRRGLRAGAMKPIACGPDGRRDAERYAALMNHEQPLDVLNPVYLRHPLAPYIAAKLEHRRINLRKVVATYHLLSTTYSPLLLEGAGGLLVPILSHCHPERSEGPRKRIGSEILRSAQNDSGEKSRPYFVADLARDLGLPLIIVARLGLGTINHTLLTIRQAQASGLKIAGIIFNDTTGAKRGLAERTNVENAPVLFRLPIFGVVPHGARKARPAAREICQRLLAL
jgi:dethiobiotin synthetase